MRARSDCKTWVRAFTATKYGPGTRRPYFAKATLPNPNRADLDCIAALFYRYKTLIVKMEGSFNYSGDFELLGDEWSVSLSGSYTVTSTNSSGLSREGDMYLYPAGGGSSAAEVDFSGDAVLTNNTTGDIWGTGEDPPRKLEFVGQNNGDVRLFRGAKIEILKDLQSITMELYVEGSLGVACNSTSSSSPAFSTIFFAQRFTSNEQNFYTGAGACNVSLYNLYGGFSAIPVFKDDHTETPIIVFSSGANSVELPNEATSEASFSIGPGDVWPYGVDPSNPKSFTTMNALWSPSGHPNKSVSEILNASLTEA